MRIALVSPPTPKIIDPTLYPPTGLAYIAGAVDKWRPGDKLDVLVLSDKSIDDAAKVLRSGYDVIGISVVSMYLDSTVELARKIRRPGTLVVAGGPHPSVERDSTLALGVFDAVFVGQAERSFVAFLNDVDAKSQKTIYEYIPGDIDDLPLPRLEFGHGDRGVVILSSRGCVNKCAFCSGSICFNGIQLHSAERVIEEVDRTIASGKDHIRFLDDMFAISSQRMKEICALLETRNVKWSCHTRADRATDELIGVMKDAGCYEIGIGVESFDQRVLDVCNKNTTIRQNISAINTIHGHGVDCHIYMMIGTPGESKTTADVNIDYLEAIRGKYARMQFSTFMPFPGSPTWKTPEAFGIRIEDRNYCSYNQHQYVKTKDGVVMLPPWSPITIDGLSREDQMSNLSKMRSYVSSLKEYRKLRIPVIAR